jgi:hypothetical protein
MNTIESNDYISRENIVYWIEKGFVQDRAMHLFGRELSDEELDRTKKYIEWGLSASVFDIIDIALKETKNDKIN